MSGSLEQHWHESVNSSPNIYGKVFRFLLSVYGEPARQISFPSRSVLAPAYPLDMEAQPKLPKSPEEIRSLLLKIAEAVRAGMRQEF